MQVNSATQNRSVLSKTGSALAVLLAGIVALTLASGCDPGPEGEAVEVPWTTDLPAALVKAREENKLVLIDFTGSDWCPPCKALSRNVFSTAAFANYASNHLVLVEADFPQRKEQSPELQRANEALAKQFDVSGYPTVVVLDGNGNQLKKETGYGGTTAKAYIAELQRLKP
jgi:protein disulfide-isomerase